MNKLKILMCLIGLCVASAMGQTTNTITFTNKYKEVIHAEVLKADSEGIVYKEINGSGMGRVAFSNLPTEIQLQFGYDAEKVREKREEIAKQSAAEAERLAKARAAKLLASYRNTIESHKFYIDPINESDFPKTEKSQAACKEITSELKGISKAIELGLNYTKFSDLLTEKVLAVEKIKDMRGEGIPHSFLNRVDECVDAYKKARDSWKDKIDAKSPTLETFCEYVMRKYWAEAGLHLIYCIGIAEGNTNANALAIDQIASIIKAEQDAVKAEILDWKKWGDPVVINMTTREISAQIRTTLLATNAPTTGTQP